MDKEPAVAWAKEQATAIAIRYPIQSLVIEYWLREFHLSPEVANIVASLSAHGWDEASLNAAVIAMVKQRSREGA